MKTKNPVRIATSPAAGDGLTHGISTPDQVVTAVKRRVLQGKLVPGQRLVEAELTREFEISRGPVREALKRLAAEGVITLSRHRGAFVRVLTRREATELLHVVQALIGLAVRDASLKLDRGRNLSRLDSAYEKLARHAPSSERATQSTDRNRFYDTILEIADNLELQRLYPVVPTQILRMQVHPHLSVGDKARQFSDYQHLYRAMRAGDSVRAQRVVTLHTRRSRMEIRKLPDAAFEIA